MDVVISFEGPTRSDPHFHFWPRVIFGYPKTGFQREATHLDGCGSKFKSQGYAGVGLGSIHLHLPREHFGYMFLSHSRMSRAIRETTETHDPALPTFPERSVAHVAIVTLAERRRKSWRRVRFFFGPRWSVDKCSRTLPTGAPPFSHIFLRCFLATCRGALPFGSGCFVKKLIGFFMGPKENTCIFASR